MHPTLRIAALILEAALCVWLVYGRPRLALGSIRRLADGLREQPDTPRLQLRFAARFWLHWLPVAALCLLALRLDGAGLAGPPLSTVDGPDGPLLGSLAPELVCVFAAGIALSLLLVAKVPTYRARQLAVLAKLQHAWALFPRTRAASASFVAVALCAGVCEELAFRRLLPVFVAHVTGDGLLVPFAVSAIAFGAAHRYQGPRGMVFTGVLGALFYGLMVTTGALWAAMCLHVLIDLRVAAMYPVLGAVPIPAAPASLAPSVRT